MNKKFKWAIPFAVLAISCGVAAGCAKHTHDYSKWGSDATQHWKECPEDNEIDADSRADHKFVDGTCECGATAPAVDVTITNGTATDAHGKLALDKTTAKTGEKVTVTVTADEGYQLKDLTVNGEGVFGAMTGNTYTFTVTENTTVVAEFEKIASSSINSVVTGKKYGVEGNSLTAGTEVVLSATGREDVKTTLKADGDKLVLAVEEIAGADWAVKVDGYAAANIAVKRDTTYSDAIALEFDLMENLSAGWGHSDASDLSQMNEGVITYKSGYYQWISSKTSYKSVAFTAKAVKGGYRQGVFLRFKGDTYSDDGFAMLEKEKQDKVCWCGAGDGYTGKNIFNGQWDDYINESGKELDNDEYDLTLVREGAKIYIFVDGEFKGTKTLPEEYADKECYVGLFCTDASTMAKADRTFKIEPASAYLDLTITDGTAEEEHGTVTIDKKTAKLQDTVTVTLTPDSGYKVKDLTVGGVSVLSKMNGKTYTFPALKNTTVIAEFEENKTVDSVEVTVTAATAFNAEGAKITFEQVGETWSGIVANGKVTLGSANNPVSLGEHTAYADFGGYQFKLGTVNITAPAEGNTATAAVTVGFTGTGIEYASTANAKPATGELSYKLGKDDNGAYNNKYDIKTIEGGFFAQKISFPADMVTAIKAGKKVSLTTILRTESGKEIKYVVQNSGQHFGIDGTFCLGLDDDSMGGGNGIFVGADANKFINLQAYTDLLLGDGLWVVINYDGATGGLVTYVGDSLDNMRPVKTWGTLPKGLKFTGFGVGNWFGGCLNSDTANLTLKYGATMQDIGMGFEDRVTVTTSVNNDEFGKITLDSKDGKYFTRTECTVTLTSSAGYYLKSVKVGDADAVMEGWTQKGNVYTFKFTVPDENTEIAATFEKKDMWDTATLVLDGVAEGTKAELYSELSYHVTAIVGANGELTLSGDTKITKEIYTVCVDNVEFVVDFTTENEFEKVIADVSSAADFTAIDTVKVIDMGAAKTATEYTVTFNLKTNSTAAGWQQRWSLILIDGNDSTVTGIGCIGMNDNMITVWGATGTSPDDDGRNPFKTDDEKLIKFDEIVHSADGVNLKVVRNGSKATMYFELEDEWVEMLTVTLGKGATNLKFACNHGVEWKVSDIEIDYVTFKAPVTASVNDKTLGSVSLDKQTYNSGDTCTVTVTVKEGNEIKSLTVGGETLTKGWTKVDEETFTYTFDVKEATEIVVELTVKQAWDSATLTLNGIAADTVVTLTDGVDTITATVGANGVVTLTGETQVGKKPYTVTVGSLVFDVDFTTESSVRKTFATATADSFNIKDTVKVIDMGAAKNSTDYEVTFNLKTNSTAAGWHQRWALILIDGNDSTVTGIGCIGMNNNVLTVWGAVGTNPNDDNRNPAFKGDEKSVKFDELVHSANGANLKVVRLGSKATMYFQLANEWVEMYSVTLGDGATNLKFACRFDDVEWQLSNIAIKYISEFDYLVNASFDGEANGYKASVEQTADGATVTIFTNNVNAAWSWFPNAITVNGTPVDFSTVVRQSLGANVCKYTFTLSDITENKDILITVAKGTPVEYEASVNDETMGTIKCDMDDKDERLYYWNDGCDITVTAKEGYELQSLVIGEGDDAVTVTKDSENGWMQNGLVYTYSFTVTGDIKVVANFAEIQEANVTFNITAKDYDGTALTLEDGTGIKFVSENGANIYTYEVGGAKPEKMAISVYKVTCAGFFDREVEVTADNGEITFELVKPFATPSANDTKNEVTVTEDKTIAIKGNGNNDRKGHRDISADLKMTEEQINSTGLTLEFTARVTKTYRNVFHGDDWAASRFGIQMGEGAVGFFVFIRDNGSNKADVVKLNPGSLDLNPDTEYKWHGDDPALTWLTIAALSDDGVQFKVERVNGFIHIYALNGEDWVQLDTLAEYKEPNAKWADDLTIANAVKNQIKFIATGDDWLFSNIKVTLPEVSEKVTCTATVNDENMGSVKLDHSGAYHKGDKVTVTATAKDGYELEKLVIGATEITETGWKQDGLVYTHTFTVEDNATIVANFKKTDLFDVNITVNATGTDGTDITPANGTVIELTSADGAKVYTYTVGGTENPAKMAAGEYKVVCYGYADTTVTVPEDGGAVTIELEKVIGYTTYDNVEINHAAGTITITGEGASDRKQKRTKNAEYVLTAEQKAAKDLTLTFNLKRDANAPITQEGGDAWAAKRAGVQIGKGNIGFFFFFRTTEGGTSTSTDVSKLGTGSDIPLDLNPGDGEKKWHDSNAELAWVVNAAHGADGLTVKVVRTGGSIKIYAQKSDGTWEHLNSSNSPALEIGNDVENEIRFVSGGDTYIFSDITVSATVEAETAITATATITRNPNLTTIDITTDEEYEVLAYDRIGIKGEAAAHVSSDEAKVNVNGWLTGNKSGSFKDHGFAVTGVEEITDGSCVYIGNGDATVVINSNVKVIRIFVGAWSGDTAQTGKFTLKDNAGNIIAEYEYANDGEADAPNKDGINDIIDFVINAEALTEDMTCTLNYTLTSGNLPCAGIQLLGEKTVTE